MENPFPTEFEDVLSSYQSIAYDGYCGEPVAWGYKIIRYIGPERFDELRRIANLEYFGEWCVVVRTLTREEATRLYDEIPSEEFGLKSGWRSTTFGDKRFVSKYHRPQKGDSFNKIFFSNL